MNPIVLDSQALEFLREYEFGPVRYASELGGGMFLRPVLIETSDRCAVLRRHAFRSTEAAFRFQAETVNHAAQQGVRCAAVLRRRDGQFGQAIDGAWWALHEYIAGSTRTWPRWSILKDQPGFMRRLGGRIARLHDVLLDARPSGEPALPVDCPPVQFDHLPAVRRHWRASIQKLKASDIAAKQSRAVLCEHESVMEDHWNWIESVWQSHGANLPRQIVHGDLSPVNMVFPDDTGDDFVLIDWDNLHVGLRMYDALGDVQNRAPVEQWKTVQCNMEHVRQYVSGYAEALAQPLSKEELACVPMFCAARHMEDLRQRLHVLTTLPAERDVEYSRLITIRLRFIRQIREFSERNGLWT